MIKAYHRVSSDKALETIVAAGEIIPAAYRLDPAVLRRLCEAVPVEGANPNAVEALEVLLNEAVDYFTEVQKNLPAPRTTATALKCQDILSGDAGRIFLAPGNWSEAGRALGWPLSGFVFDAEDLIRKGAVVRKWDYFSAYAVLLRDVLQGGASSAEAAGRAFLDGLSKIHGRQLQGAAAVDQLLRYDVTKDQEHLKPQEFANKLGFSAQEEVIWEGPLSLDLAVEIWKDDVIIEERT